MQAQKPNEKLNFHSHKINETAVGNFSKKSSGNHHISIQEGKNNINPNAFQGYTTASALNRNPSLTIMSPAAAASGSAPHGKRENSGQYTR